MSIGCMYPIVVCKAKKNTYICGLGLATFLLTVLAEDDLVTNANKDALGVLGINEVETDDVGTEALADATAALTILVLVVEALDTNPVGPLL